MGLFRRAKPLHEQLAEQADLDIGRRSDGDGEPGQRTPSRLAGLMHGLADGFLSAPPDDRPAHRSARSRCTASRDRASGTRSRRSPPELPGDEVRFTSLPDGTLLVEEDVPDGALGPLADAIEASISRPTRAEGVRRDDAVWAVGREADPGALVHRATTEDELELRRATARRDRRRLDGDLFESRGLARGLDGAADESPRR